MTEGPEPKPGRRSRTWVRLLLLVVLPLIGLAVAGWLYSIGGRYVETDNAYVRADKVAVAPLVSGRVVEVAVHENQLVAAGMLLFRIDDEGYRLALARADARLATVRYEVEALKANWRQKQEQLRSAETDIAFFEREFGRQQELARSRVATEARLDEARYGLDSARRRLATLRPEAERVLAQLGGSADIPVERHPSYREALAARDQAALELSRTRVIAPGPGVVSRVDSLQVGDFVQAGAPALALVDLRSAWIEANLKETDLTHVAVGQPASVRIDTYPDRVFKAEVTGISAATGAEFSLLPAQNSSGNWVKVVQRVPIRLRLVDTAEVSLRAGMSVVIAIDTGHERPLPAVVRGAMAWVGR